MDRSQRSNAVDGATLHRGPDRGPAIEALTAYGARRVGLDGVLADLDRRGEPTDLVPRLVRVEAAFTWERADRATRRWWPQGITTSADASPDGTVDGRPVLLTSAYAKPVGGVGQGSRITVVDLSDERRPRYAHVLLVQARLDEQGVVSLGPLQAHVGGIVWHGGLLHVAATAKGFWTCALDDVLRVDPLPAPEACGVGPEGVATFGHRFVLPVRWGHASRTPDGAEPLRFSFLSRSHGVPGPPEIMAGEYGHGSMTTRLWHYDLDPATHLLAADAEGVSRPRPARVVGVERMQGAVVAHGRTYVTSSRGRLRRGSLWAEDDGVLHEHAYALPPGPEDVAYWPERDQLWTLTEHPHTRAVVGLDRRRFG